MIFLRNLLSAIEMVQETREGNTWFHDVIESEDNVLELSGTETE